MTPPARLAAAVLVALAGLLGACGDDVSRTEVARAPAPDAAVDALVVETDGGATTPFGYMIHLVPHGCGPDGPPALRVVGARRNATGASGVTLAWTGARELAVRYLDAQFTDPETSPTVAVPPAAPVTIRLVPGAAEPAATPGPMAASPGARPVLPSC